MELIIYLVLAVSGFCAVIGFIIGLISAPTSVLVTILVVGLIFTQKLINYFAESKVSILEAKDNEKREKVEEITLSNPIKEVKKEQNSVKTDLTYRGSHYKHKNLDKSPLHKTLTQIKYRGLTVAVNKKLTNLGENITSK
jgi:hypothetical protein